MSKVIKTVGAFQKLAKFNKGVGALLPEAYKKFYKEWQVTEPTAVHYVPEEGKWKRDDVTGEVTPIQDIPIPLKFPVEHDEHIWGGEGVVQGFIKKDYHARRVPHFWIPVLKRSVIYSEVLNKHISVIVTNRTINLIHANYGFDHYILKTPACDLKSLLALSLKRKILQELQQGCPSYANDPEKQKEILSQYKQYLSSYTTEEIEWYGYSFQEACSKIEKTLGENNKTVPLKHLYRATLIESLHNSQLEESVGENAVSSSTSSWIQKMNPFGKKHEA